MSFETLRARLRLGANLVEVIFGGIMPVDDDTIEALRGLLDELKGVVGDKAFALPSVRKAIAVLARHSQQRGKSDKS